MRTTRYQRAQPVAHRDRLADLPPRTRVTTPNAPGPTLTAPNTPGDPCQTSLQQTPRHAQGRVSRHYRERTQDRSSPAGRGEQLDTRITAVDAADLISKVTEPVNEELAAWRNWPLDRICPVQARSGGRLGPARTSSGTTPVMRDPVTRQVECRPC